MANLTFERFFFEACKVKNAAIGFILLWLLLFCSCSQTPTNAQNKIKKPAHLNKKMPKAAGKRKMNGELNYPIVSKESAVKELESYIFDIHYGRKTEPRNLDPAHVEEFIRTRLDRSKQSESFARARMVVDFYDLVSVLDYFEDMLKGNEKDAQTFQQSVQIVRILAEKGDSKTRNKAIDYYQNLVKNPLAETEFEELIKAVNSFDGGFSPDALLEEINKTYTELKERGKSDSFIDGQAEELYTLMKSRLPQFLAHLKLREAIANTANPEQKIYALTKLYLGQADAASTELERWAARILRSEARKEQTEVIIKNMRRVSTEIEEAGFEKEEKLAFQARSARAVRFFAGNLTDEEQKLIEQADDYQIDFLDRDFYKGDV